jgi:hypothetical protein
MRLLDDLNRATNDYANAAADISGQTGLMPEADYKRRRMEVEEARRDAEHCRTALLKHRAEHGC